MTCRDLCFEFGTGTHMVGTKLREGRREVDEGRNEWQEGDWRG